MYLRRNGVVTCHRSSPRSQSWCRKGVYGTRICETGSL